MTESELKSLLLSLEECKTDFSIEFASKRLKSSTNSIRMGDYDDQTHRIRLFGERHDDYKTLINTLIHEFAHHLMWEYFHTGKLKKRVVHGKEFWQKYNELIQKAKIKGYFNENNVVTDSRISEIVETWFIREPLMMLTLLSHEIVVNLQIENFRCGQGLIEYNPNYSQFLTKEQIEERLKAEVIRILLNHPYRHHANKKTAYQASNITLNEYYSFRELTPRAKEFWQTQGFFRQNFEFYVCELQKLPPQNSDDAETYDKSTEEREESGRNLSNLRNLCAEQEAAELWDQDDFMTQKIKEIIENAVNNTTQWGSIPEYLKQTLIANLCPQVDYRKILRSFRASIVSSDKFLTRYKPSRRYGWQYMGKKNDFTTNLLIAVDVSGSISDSDLRNFYSIINRFFKYGIKQINVIQFDTEIKGEAITIKRAKSEIKILGRGGTCFQPAIDFFSAHSNLYDGLIVFTDGYAEIPTVSAKITRKTLWLCSSKSNYERHKEWMEKHGKCCWIE